ncbi:MAG: archaellum operon transcriptional activator EarA family protein [Candidatus Aenigmatarchaeota archaeon]
MKWDLYSFVVRSEQRKKVILSLKEPKTPTQIAKDVKLSTSHVSRSLADFLKKGIVSCLTPKEKIGRVYELTPEGKKILERLSKEG